MAWKIIFCVRGVALDWISSVFEIFTVFWMEVLSLCWSWWDIIFRVELVVYDVWFAEDDNTGFLSVGLDIFDRFYLKERPISLPMVPMSTINKKYGKSYYVRRIDKNRNMWKKLMNNQNIMFRMSLFNGKSQKSKNDN